MADVTIAAPLKVSTDGANQVTITAAGTATASFIDIVVPDGTTNEAIIEALDVARAACVRDPIKFRAH